MEKLTTSEILNKYYPGGYFGHDRDGRPVFIEPLPTLDFVGLLHSVKVEDVLDFKRRQCEEGKRLCKAQEEKLGLDIDKYTTLVLDAYGASRKHLWKPGVHLYQTIVKLYEDEYPELRQRIVVVNTPAIFPIIFSLIKPFISQSTKDKIKVLGSNWRNDIHKYISPENLPEHYGGTCRYDNDNPKCEECIVYGSPVPKSCYVIENLDTENFEKVTVSSGSTLEIIKHIDKPNSKINYQFITTAHDIGFAVDYVFADGDKLNIIPNERKSSNINTEEGMIECEKTGNYSFTFDNWIREKEIFYLIKVTDE